MFVFACLMACRAQEKIVVIFLSKIDFEWSQNVGWCKYKNRKIDQMSNKICLVWEISSG